MQQAASVGIIGGADGPTAVFITSNLSLTTLLWGLLGAAVVGGLVALWFFRR